MSATSVWCLCAFPFIEVKPIVGLKRVNAINFDLFYLGWPLSPSQETPTQHHVEVRPCWLDLKGGFVPPVYLNYLPTHTLPKLEM